MKIAVDARMYNMSGIGTYIQNLTKNNCYNIALGNEKDLKGVKGIEKIIKFDSPIYGINEQLKFPYKELKKAKVDLLHVPHYNVPLFYKGDMIVTIHDLTHLVYSEFFGNPLKKYYAKFMMKMAIKKSKAILTVSECTKRDILKYFKLDENKIIVTYNGLKENAREKPKEEISYLYDKFNIPRDKKILMYVGNLKPHKNLEGLLESFSKLKNNSECILLLVGKAFENYLKLQEKEKELNIENKVIHTGIVNEEELIDLYNLIDLFVFPSFYEGFGLPVIEAMACGAKVVSSNASSLPEVGGNLIPYFDPKDIEDMTKKIEEEFAREDTIAEKIERIKWAKSFDWKETAKKTNEIFKIYDKQ